MTETSVVDSSKEKPEKESSSRMSQSEDAYAPEEPTPDIPISLLDIQMPETPESTKGQVSDGDLPRLESPKLLKPVLGKLQAKKRLMAFANKFNVLPKIQKKSNLLQVHSAKFSKSKSIENDSSTGLNTDSDSMQHCHNRHLTSGKSKKKTEEKILAIEEIRREESKSKMLLAEAMAAASLDEESYTNRNGQNLLESVRSSRERSRQGDLSASRKSVSKSSIDNKYSVRRRHGREERRDSASRESKDYSSSKDRYYKGPHDREQRRRDKDKDKKDDKDKRDDSSKYEEGRDRREDEGERKDNEKDKWEDVKEKRGAKEKKETFSEKRSNSKEKSSEARDKREKEKDKDKGKEKDVMNSFSWVDLKKCGIMMDDVIDVRRRDYSDRSTKNRTAEDYVRHFEQMLMLNDCRLKRYAFVAEGLDGPKEYPPESVRITKRGRPQLQYSENPRISLFLNRQQVLQAVATDRREKMREICEVNFIRDNAEEAEKPQLVRNWYPKTGVHEPGETAKWPLPVNVQLPRSKWDSEDEERLSNDVAKGQESEEKPDNATAQPEQEVVSSRSSTAGEDIGDDKKTVNEDKESPSVKETDNDNRQSTSPSLPSAGNEKLASEYEQFMKMVCTDIPAEDFSPKVIPAKSASPSSYHEFNIETNLPEDNNFAFVEHSMSGKSDKADTSQTEERYKDNESRQNVDEVSKVSDDEASSSSSQIQVQERIRDDKDKHESEDSRSIPSDWENVRIKVERLSDENSDTREVRKKKRRKKVTSSSESSSSSSSSDSEEDAKRKRRKRKLSNDDSSVSDSDSSESSSSSSDSSSSDDKRKKKRKKKRKAEKRKKKAKRLARTKKKRRRKMSSDSSSSDSSDEKRKKKAVSRKKSKQKRKYSEKSQDDNEDIIKVIQKSSLEASSPENEKLIRSQVPIKKIKEERKAESRKRSTEKHDIWSKEQELVRKSQKDEEKRDKGEERYLEEWEMDTVILPQQKGERMSKNNIEKMGNTEVESIRKMEKKDERNKKDERSRKDEHFKEKRTGVGKEIVQGSAKAEEESDAKKKKKRDKEKKSSNEFLADWEKESERMSQQIMQDEIRLSKKLDKQKKEKWGETEFDTLNVPSLTQLEREVSKRQLLADDWEVDSLEAVPDLMVNKKKSSRTSKKLEKEVRYDKKTDTYISIEKESSRECKKRQDRLSAMRIWEEEQEEGEREAMMLLEQKNKKKRDEWDIEEESFLREKDERNEKIEDNLPTIDNIHKEVNTPNKDMDIALKHDAISAKKSKKSRWDIASQSEEKLELKAPVMWEEECTEWTKLNTFDRKIDEVTLGRCETTLPKSKIKDEDVEQQPTKSTTSSDIIDLFPRKSQDVDLLDPSWTPEELGRSKSRIKSLENTSQTVDVFFEKSKEHTPAPSTKEQEPAKQLEDIFEINATLTDKNIELYSPSSPALSQKSEDIEAFNDSNLNTFNLREDLSQDELKKETSTKSDEESISVSNIPLQIKYREGKYAKSAVTKEQLEDILSMQAEDQSEKKFDVKAPETSLDDLATNEPCLDASNYKQLRMDIFAEYESDESRGKPNINVSEVTSTTSVKDESPEGKAALKLIPKQLLIRRNNERGKAKLISDDPMQHAAALLTIQKKLRESHAVRNDIKSASCEEPANEFEFERKKTTDGTAVVDTVSTEQTTVTDVKVDSKDLSITVKTSITTKSESPSSIKVDFDRVDEYKSGEKRSRSEEIKKPRDKESDTEAQGKSPSREQRRKSPGKKENDRRLGDRGKEKRDKKFDDRERNDRRDSRSSESRRKSSPSSSRGRRRRSVSPHTSWERERSRSKSRSRSWSRSRSKSPRRRDESSSREKRSSRVDEDRCRSRTDDRRERSTRSPRPNTAVYNKDYYKKYGPSKGDRDDWSRRKYDCMERDRDKDGRSYDSMEALRERNIEPDRHREGRFRGDEADRPIWPYESDNALRDGNESIDSYPNSQDLDLDYEEKTYYRDDSIERDIIEGPLRPMPKFKQRRSRSDTRRDRQWENDRESLDLERHGHVRRSEKLPPSRGRSPPRSRRTSPRVSHDRYRRGSRSRSRSWSRSRSRTRSRSRSRSRTRSRSRSTSRSRSMRSRSRSRSRSRTRSTSRSRLRSPDHSQRIAERLRSSRSPSVERGRVSESSRERKDEHDNRQLDNCNERGRRIETIVQSVSGLSRNSSMLDSEMHIGDGMEPVATSFQYANENEVGNEYYYTENNLTYPPCIDDSATNSPKRLSLDDRLELELGIKKQQDTMGVSSDYPDNFNSNVCYATSPQQQQMLYHQQATVLQVGNVLQVVPADFNGVPAARREPINSITTPMSSVRGSSQVVRVGNVLQVVPTSLDWSGGQPSTVDQPTGMMYSATVPQPSPVPSVPSTPISIPVPVPVPLPVPGVPPVITPTTPIATLSPVPIPLSVPVPVPGPGPISLPVSQVTFPRPEATPQKVPAQPVYNYEAILETRRKEREERKRLRELRRKEKERRRIERINRRALRLLEKSNRQSDNSNQSKSSPLDPSVLKALREGEEQTDADEQQPVATLEKEDEPPVAGPSTSTEEEDAVADEDEEEEEEEEAEVEDDEEDEEEPEDDEEEEEEDDEKSRVINRRIETDDVAIPSTSEVHKVQVETESKEWLDLPPTPLKGILVASGFRTSLPNGNLDDLSTPENDSEDNAEEGAEADRNDANKDEADKLGRSKGQSKTKSKSLKLSRKKRRSKKFVQFADGIKPGEGTSPSGGEGDMPSPPPPTSGITRDGVREIRRSSSRKNRKQEKRTRPPKAKKKVKVKIIKLKKPRVTPLTAMMMDDSDELDDRSPPPPPLGSPPPPHLWPSYLAAYNSSARASEAQTTTPAAASTVQAAPPPPTPLPLLVPPPPLNYTIQPCSKA